MIVDFGWNSNDTCTPEVMNRCARVACEQPPGNPAGEDSLVAQIKKLRGSNLQTPVLFMALLRSGEGFLSQDRIV